MPDIPQFQSPALMDKPSFSDQTPAPLLVVGQERRYSVSAEMGSEQSSRGQESLAFQDLEIPALESLELGLISWKCWT
jgi:hypothetical protein